MGLMLVTNIRKRWKHTPLQMSFWASATLFLLGFAFVHSPILMGDGSFYWATLENLAREGTPSISEEVGGLVIEAKSGDFYGIHFFAYSLVSVPAYWILDLLGLSTLKAFQLTNAVLMSLAIFIIFFRSGIPKLAQWVVVVGFLGSGLYYIGWSHPEIFSSVFILLASLAFLDRRHPLAAFFSAVASLQNPSAILFLAAIVLDLVIGARAQRIHSWEWQRLFSDVLKVMLASSPFAVPYLWSMLKFGVWNPIESRGFVNYRNMNFDRLWSLVFDLNQGLIIGLPLLVFLVPLAIGARLVNRLRKVGDLFTRSDLLIAAFLLMALPVLTQENWNAGHSVFIRYAVWLGILPLVWVAGELAKISRTTLSAVLVPAVFLQGSVFIWAGGPFVRQHPSHVEFKPWVVALWQIAPKAYNPLPEIFIERLRAREGGAATPISLFNFRGEPVKTLTTAVDLDGALNEICGANSYLFEPKPAGHKELRFTRTEKGFSYVLGPVSCDGWANIAMSGKEHHPNPAPFESGWSRPEDWGTWSDGGEAIIRFPENQWNGASRVKISGRAFLSETHLSQTFEAEVNGVFVGRLQVSYGNSEFEWELDTQAANKTSGEAVVTIRIADAKSPFELGLSSDTRKLGIGLHSIEILQ